MANVMRWRRGATNPVVSDAVVSATVIEIGDMVTDTPAGQAGNTATDFLGVAEQASRNGDTDSIRVATRGVFEFICASGTWDQGDLVTCDGSDSQTVVAGTSANAHGRVTKTYSSATTTVEVEIFSRVMAETGTGT